MATLGKTEFARRAEEIRWILCDVDGVLTDGGLYYDHRGHSLLRFDVRDGLALKLAQSSGLKIGVLTGRRSRALKQRADELGFDDQISASQDKGEDFADFLERHQIVPRQVAYIGDDLPDLVVLGRCGLSFAPADAADEVRTVAHRVLAAGGGHGAVREMIESLLRARGEWDSAVAPFTLEQV